MKNSKFVIGALGVLSAGLVGSSLAIPSCNGGDDNPSDVFSANSEVEFTLLPSTATQAGSDEYRLRRVLLRRASETGPGFPTYVWGQVKYATLIFECSNRMDSAVCGEFDPSTVSVFASAVSGTTTQTKDLAKGGSSVVEVQEPSDLGGTELILRREHAEFYQDDALVAALDNVDESNGRFLVTVPIDNVLDLSVPEELVRITIANGQGGETSSEGFVELRAGQNSEVAQETSGLARGSIPWRGMVKLGTGSVVPRQIVVLTE